MDKTISISLGGFSFIVDDRAFFKLKNYLDDIRRSLQGMEGTEDIIADVEVRIAELFKERLKSREVVNEQDVDHIIQVMGRPEQYMDEDSEDSTSKGFSGAQSYSSTEKVKKKLYRDPDDKVLAGVLSGIAHYIGVETWVTRVIFIILLFSDIFVSLTSATVISYIVLWIILPKAETASQKYEMYGQAGDFQTIKKNVSQAASEMRGVAKDASSTLSQILSVFVKLILIFFGVVLICAGIGFIAAAIGLIITTSSSFPVQILGYIVDYGWQDWLLKLFFFLMMAIPGILFILFGIRLISSRAKINKTFVFSAMGIWLLSMIGTLIIGGTLVKNFAREIEFSEKKSYSIAHDTLTIEFEKYKEFKNRRIKWEFDSTGGFVEFNGKLLRRIEDDVEFRESPDDQVYVEVVYSSKGSNIDDAKSHAEKINYNYQMNSRGELTLDRYLSLPKGAKFRNPDVSVIVYVPKGKVVHTKNVDDVIFENDLYDRSYEDGENRYFRFNEHKFECLNCPIDGDDDWDDDWDDDDKLRVIKIGDDDDAHVNISKEGINIQSGSDKKIIVEKKKVKISDGTDSININISGD